MTMQHYYTTFKTTLGQCAVLWTGCGLKRLQLPERNAEAAARMLVRGVPDAVKSAPVPCVAVFIKMVQKYLCGRRIDFSEVATDMDGCTIFQRKVYDATQSLEWGETASYGEIARRIGSPNASRAVGGALGANPLPLVVPCHRVLAAGKKLGGFSGGLATKARLLALEGVRYR